MLYANAPFILLALLPIPLRERRWYRAMLFWYYTAVNAVLVVALNLADAVYFHYTQKRFTAEELFFADNDNSLALALRFAAENWYLVLAGIGLIVLLVKGYGRRIRPESPLRPGWGYYLVNTALLLLAALLTARCRNKWTAALPPVLCNAILIGALIAWEEAGVGNGFPPAFFYNALTVGLGEAVHKTVSFCAAVCTF